MAYASINGTALPNVKNLPRELKRAGRGIVAKSGKRTWLQQATRTGHEVLTIELEHLTRAQANAVKALVYDSLSITPMTLADGQGTTWSVQAEEDTYRESVDGLPNGVPTYAVTLKLYQAN